MYFPFEYYKDKWYMGSCTNLGMLTKLRVTPDSVYNQYRIVNIECWDAPRKEGFINACRNALAICSKEEDKQVLAYQATSGIIMRFGFFNY